jgi:hypothetical protein
MRNKVGCTSRAWFAGLLLIHMSAPTLAEQTWHVRPWTIPNVSSDAWESHPAIDPLTGDLWLVRSDRTFSGWRIFTARCEGGAWSQPEPMPLAGEGLEADPWFSADGRTLWFISTRATGEKTSASLDIWRAQRDESGAWRAPERLPEPVNSNAAEWFPRPASDGWLYFGSRRSGGLGKDDIWRAKQSPSGWTIENLGADMNTADAEYEFLPAPNGTWGLLATDKGLYRAVPTSNGWRRAEKLGPEINVNGTEIGPMFTPDGRSFVFSRDAGEKTSGELFIAAPSGAQVDSSLQKACERTPMRSSTADAKALRGK